SEPIAGPDSSSQPLVTPLPAVTDSPAAEKLPDLGTYLGDKTVLLRWDDPKGAWFRVSPRSTVEAGARLLALPEFRPKLTFASGVHLEMSGGTRVAVDRAETNGASDLPAARAGVPAIDVAYGRVVLLNTANNENSVLLILGTDRVEVGLDRNAVLAVEVNRPYVPGNDPLTSAVPMEVKLYAPEGGVLWRDASGEKKIDQSSEWSIANGEMSAITANPTLPEWIDHEPPLHRSEQMYGAPVVEEALAIDRPADDQLLELWQGSEGKRKEVKSLAARSSIHVGLFVPFVESLRDSEQRPNWEKHIETLREAMARDRAAAESIRNTLVEQRGEVAAAELYEMLRGYDAEQIGKTPEQVRAGAIADLIDRLESDSLDYRVLAVQNLWEITGKRLMPNPAASLTERGLNVRRWRNRLEAGELVPSGE
ncbi:MAG: hypothetical protein L0Z07_00325, partial [Planctomycetes bacterium]|nr:hypothetical protein [Planctomycetota bacterium]